MWAPIQENKRMAEGASTVGVLVVGSKYTVGLTFEGNMAFCQLGLPVWSRFQKGGKWLLWKKGLITGDPNRRRLVA